MVKFCFECGARNNGGKFCSECGTRFPEGVGGGGGDASAAGGGGASFDNAAMLKTVSGGVAALPASNSTSANAASYNNFRQSASTVNSTMNTMDRASSFASNNGYGRQSSMKQPPPPPPPPPPAVAVTAAPAAQPGSYMSRSYSQTGDYNANQSFNGNSGYNNSVQYAPTPIPEAVPTAATGGEAQECYEQCVTTIRNSRGGNNEPGVKAFKQNCKMYGLKQIDVKTFYDSLTAELGPEATVSFVPTLARLIPDDIRRRELIEYNAEQRSMQQRSSAMFGPNGTNRNTMPSYNRDSSSSSDSNVSRPSSVSGGGSKGILKNRYGDHPNCDICNVSFDVTKRRHQCRHCGKQVCSACSPVRLLIPPGREVPGAKGYDPSVPQRICINCAPELHQFQDELATQYAQANEQNVHQAGGRIHVPFSSNLNKECRNAADIIGNFFRNEWGASSDRSIPVAFLQKAHGLAIMTIVKAGFLITGKVGTGLVVAKLPDGSWSAPSAIGTFGLGGGFEIGGELVEIMIILGSEGAVKVFHKPQVNLGAGLDIAVGPYGRSAQAAAAVSTGGLNANYSYSQSKGLYAGISLQGAVIAARSDLNRKFYARDLSPQEILSGYVAPPKAAEPLYEAIDRAMQGIEEHKQEVSQRASIMGPCRLCNCPMFVAHTKQVWNKNCKTCKHVH